MPPQGLAGPEVRHHRPGEGPRRVRQAGCSRRAKQGPEPEGPGRVGGAGSDHDGDGSLTEARRPGGGRARPQGSAARPRPGRRIIIGTVLSGPTPGPLAAVAAQRKTDGDRSGGRCSEPHSGPGWTRNRET